MTFPADVAEPHADDLDLEVQGTILTAVVAEGTEAELYA